MLLSRFLLRIRWQFEGTEHPPSSMSRRSAQKTGFSETPSIPVQTAFWAIPAAQEGWVTHHRGRETIMIILRESEFKDQQPPEGTLRLDKKNWILQ